MASGLIWDEEGNDITMDALSAAVEADLSSHACGRCSKGPLTPEGPYRDAHFPCCSSHKIDMCCACYRRTHFVEVGPCH